MSEGASPAIVADHAFEPRVSEVGVSYAGWSYIALPPNPYLCAECGLAEAAHERSSTGGYDPPGRYRCPRCVERGTRVCRKAHRGAIGR